MEIIRNTLHHNMTDILRYELEHQLWYVVEQSLDNEIWISGLGDVSSQLFNTLDNIIMHQLESIIDVWKE